MTCSDFECRLELFAAGMLPPREEESIHRHLDACDRCRSLAGALRGEAGMHALEIPVDLTSAILCSTSGPACPEGERHLCAWADGMLAQMDRELLALHLEHCFGCRKLADTLAELKEILPGMATLEPDPYFTVDVLKLAMKSRSRENIEPPPLKLAVWWRRLMRRPRFAWEAAYIGTILILIILGNPAIQPRALAVPDLLADRSGQLLQQATLAFADHQTAARRSYGDLRQKGIGLWEHAVDLEGRTTSALRSHVTSILDDLESAFSDERQAGPPKSDLR
jgi:hypothetical protein